MERRAVLFLAALLTLAGGINTGKAGVGDWHTYTAKRNIRAATADSNGIIWAISDGGMFSYNPSASQPGQAFTEYTTSEGLQTTDLTAITIDRQGRLWIGASNGVVQLYDPQKGQWQSIDDISSSTSPQKSINGFRIIGDTIFVLSDLGVSIFSISNMQFGDTYGLFGAGADQISGSALSLELFNGKYWVGTTRGLASTPLTNPNPSTPESWTLYDSVPGLGTNAISGIVSIGDSLIVSTANGLYVYSNGTWSLIAGTSGLNIKSMAKGTVYACPGSTCPEDYPIFVTSSNLWRGPGYPGESGPVIVPSIPSTNLSSVFFRKEPIIGTMDKGIVIPSTGSSWKALAPPGPLSNSFVGIAVDDNGVLWSGTGVTNGTGFMSFDGSLWKSYTSDLDSRLGTGSYYSVTIGPNNTKWVSNYGVGVALLNSAGIVQKVYTVDNGLLPTLAPSQDPLQRFVVVGGVATDRRGYVWITDRTPPNDTSLVVVHPDSSLSYITGFSVRSPLRVFSDVLIDEFNTKWFTNFDRFASIPPDRDGLYYYNDTYSLPGTSSGWGRLTADDDGLGSNQIWSLAEGHDGDVWVGTSAGISIIFNPQDPHAVAIYHPLPDQVIQDILTDPVNNKWVATRQGVFVLSPDGTSIVKQYTVENTAGKLLDNDVTSLAIDLKKGILYCGTSKGLSTLTTAAVAPKSAFDGLTVSPNPFRLPSARQLTVDGLVQGSTLKILTIGGALVRELQTPGGRVGYWDGKNENGEYVSSGIYLIIAYSQDGDQIAKGKVAVIRK